MDENLSHSPRPPFHPTQLDLLALLPLPRWASTPCPVESVSWISPASRSPWQFRPKREVAREVVPSTFSIASFNMAVKGRTKRQMRHRFWMEKKDCEWCGGPGETNRAQTLRLRLLDPTLKLKTSPCYIMYKYLA